MTNVTDSLAGSDRRIMTGWYFAAADRRLRYGDGRIAEVEQMITEEWDRRGV